MEHTKEPWKTGKNGKPFFVGDSSILGVKEGNEFILAQCNHNFEELSKANARRIVACVNACEGIPTKDLEVNSGAVLDLVLPNLLARAETAEADRDKWKAMALELGEALFFITTFGASFNATENQWDHVLIAEKAITRLKEMEETR